MADPAQPTETVDHLAARVSVVEKEIHDLEDHLEADNDDPKKGNDTVAEPTLTDVMSAVTDLGKRISALEEGGAPAKAVQEAIDAQARRAAAMGRPKTGGPLTEDKDPNAERVNDDVVSTFNLSAWPANVKRTYDAYQQRDLRSLDAAERHTENLHTIQLQILADMAAGSRRGVAVATTADNQLATAHVSQQQLVATQTASTKA